MQSAFRELRADYSAAKPSRFRRKRPNTASQGSGADYHYRGETDYLGLMEQARDLERNDPLAGRMVDCAVTNTVQGGFNIDPQTGDEKLDLLLWEKWQKWAGDPDECDIAGELTFNDIEIISLRRMFFDGDIFVLLLRNGRLQLVEAHRCRTPHNTNQNVVHGVMLGDNRERIEYWFTKDELSPYSVFNRVSDAVRYAARDAFGHKQVLHLYKPSRVSQTRGVTAFAPVFDFAAMLDDIQFAKLVQQQAVSCWAILRQKTLADPSGEPPTYGPAGTDGYGRSTQGLSPGMEVIGNPGETVSAFSSNIPNPEYFQQVSMIVRMIAANIGAPPEVSLFDTTQTTFHGYRGAVDEARRGFRANQRLLMTRLHGPVYRWKLRQWAQEDPALGRTAKTLGDRYYNHKCNPPNWPYIDASKDAAADALRLEKGLTSPRRWASERGFDYEELTDESIGDNLYRISKAQEAAEEFNGRYPDYKVSWRDILKPLEGEVVYTGKASVKEHELQEQQTTQKEDAIPPTPPPKQDDSEQDDGASDDEE